MSSLEQINYNLLLMYWSVRREQIAMSLFIDFYWYHTKKQQLWDGKACDVLVLEEHLAVMAFRVTERVGLSTMYSESVV